MKVGILTFHWANNYGAVLQAYALCHVLNDMGHQVRFIDYAPESLRLRGWQGWGLRSGKELPARALWRMRFAWFRQRYLPTTRRCRTKEALNQVARGFDAVIVGSDQVWNGNIAATFDPTYFLDFVEDASCRKISYAACFGTPEQPEECLAKAGEFLKRFHALSARNEMSAHLAESLSGKKPDIVVDPTLLHEFDELVAPAPRSNGYIAAYYLAEPHLATGIKILKILKKNLGLPIVLVGVNTPVAWADDCITSAGPIQWLKIFQGASFVCTDSFHGTVFSTKLRKPFIAWPGYRPERIRDFLRSCGLENRLVVEPQLEQLQQLIKTEIDFSFVSRRLETHKTNALNFLNRALFS